MSRSVAASIVAVFLCLAPAISHAASASESIVVFVKVFPTSGREDELHARYLKQLEFLRKTEPKATFTLYRSAKQPTTFLWRETYESQAAYDQHLKVAMPAFRREFGPTPEGLIAKPSESETYRQIGD